MGRQRPRRPARGPGGSGPGRDGRGARLQRAQGLDDAVQELVDLVPLVAVVEPGDLEHLVCHGLGGQRPRGCAVGPGRAIRAARLPCAQGPGDVVEELVDLVLLVALAELAAGLELRVHDVLGRQHLLRRADDGARLPGEQGRGGLPHEGIDLVRLVAVAEPGRGEYLARHITGGQHPV